jgi:type II secretory pathway component PulC
MKATRALIVFLGLAGAALAGTVAFELRQPPAASPAIRDGAAAPARKTSAKAAPLPRADNVRAYDAISNRPLFSETRRPPDPVAEDAPEADADVLRHIGLTGVVITRERKTALVYSQKSPVMLNLQEGESLEGWHLDQVLQDRIVLSRGGETAEIVIWDKTRPRPPRRKPPSASKTAKKGPDGARPSAKDDRAKPDAPAKTAERDQKPDR